MTQTFEQLGVHANLIEGLKKEGITEPTDIQAQAIPLALQNKDIIGQSQTGSGKTLAYLLPIYQKIDPAKRENQAIILAPTHELVMQIHRVIQKLSEDSGVPVTSTPVMGEVNIQRQIDKLKEKPHIIVGSTGRILELIKKKKISAHAVKTIVIDEGDRLLDERKLGEVKEVIKTTMKDRQLMVFSATIQEKVLNTAKALMKDAEVVRVEDNRQINPNIEHLYFVAETREKVETLRKLIAAMKPQRGIVFVNDHDELLLLTAKLQYHHINAFGIHGTSSKEERQRAMEGFRSGKVQILVASDVAARGLDIQDVTHVFNFDLPKDGKEYLHRVGRTGRVGKSGVAVSIVSSRDVVFLKKLGKMFGVGILERDVVRGEVVAVRRERPSGNDGENAEIKAVRVKKPVRRKSDRSS